MMVKKGGNKMKSFLTFIALFILLSVSANSADYDASKQTSGIVIVLEGNSATLTLDGETEYTLKVEQISGKLVLATVDGRALNLEIGQEREYDLDNDGTNDTYIILNNIIDKLVSFRIQKLVTFTSAVEDDKGVGAEETEDQDEVIDVETDTEDQDEEKDIEDPVNNEITGAAVGTTEGIGKWIIGGVIVVIIIIVIIFVMSGGDNAEKNYEKAMDLHREGQEFHYDGDDDTAKELYEKAEELREKARNMGGGF